MRIQTCLTVALVLLLSCGPGEGPSDGGRTADAASDAMAADPCVSHSDCDDELFCNGSERCVPGSEDADARGCVPGAAPCIDGQSCDELRSQCVTDCGGRPDADGDGDPAEECGGTDCDDSDPRVNPSRPETCDAEGRDEDCNPETLSGPAITDADGDGYVDAACCNVQRTGALLCGLDCDDSQSASRPGLPESCDGIDNDCDLSIDEGVRTTYYRDDDGDLYGRDDDEVSACAPPAGYVASGGDCDDARVDARPGAPEVCNALDDDCDGSIDEEVTPAPETPEHCGSCGARCPDGYECNGSVCEDRPLRLITGIASTCALTRSGSVYCWGGNTEGEIGVGSGAAVVDVPSRVVLPSRALDVAIMSTLEAVPTRYRAVACALLEDGSERCWGSSLGPSPTRLPVALPANTVEMGGHNADLMLARTSAGAVFLLSSDVWRPAPLATALSLDGWCTRRASLRDVEHLPEGSLHAATRGGTLTSSMPGGSTACATDSSARVLCWGDNSTNQAGPGPSPVADATLVAGLPTLPVVSVTSGSVWMMNPGGGASNWGHSCAVLVDGRAFCWGANSRGQLGTGSSSSPQASPLRVGTTVAWQSMAAGSEHTCAISDEDEVWCWGANDGRLGTADTSDAHLPVRLFGLPAVTSPSGS